MDLLSTIVFTSFFIYTSFGTQVTIISFDLADSDVNEVVFVNERDIVLQCSVLGASSVYMISIGHENRDGILTATPNEMCSVHKINEVSINDGGEYTCTVSYLTMNGVMENKTKTLQLNVQYNERPHCFRNGTASGIPYLFGDVLLLSCYCLGGEMPCRWIQTVPGTQTSSPVDTYGTGKRSNKMVIRILVNVGSLNSPTNTRYVCFSGGSSSQQCTIGPQSVSSTDLVMNSNAVNTSVDCQHGELMDTSTLMTQEEELPTDLNTIRSISKTITDPNPVLLTTALTLSTRDNVMVIAVSAGVCIVLVLIITILIMVSLFKCRTHRSNQKSNTETNQLHINDAYTADSPDQHRKDTFDNNGSTELGINSRRDTSHIDHMKREATGNSGDLYAKVDKGKQKFDEDMSETEGTGEHHNLSQSEQDPDTLYAKVNKDSKTCWDKNAKTRPASKHSETPESKEDFSSLYGKVDKSRRNTKYGTGKGKTREHVDDSDMYAEIDKK